MVWCPWLCAHRKSLKLFNTSDLLRSKPLGRVAMPASLSARPEAIQRVMTRFWYMARQTGHELRISPKASSSRVCRHVSWKTWVQDSSTVFRTLPPFFTNVFAPSSLPSFAWSLWGCAVVLFWLRPEVAWPCCFVDCDLSNLRAATALGGWAGSLTLLSPAPCWGSESGADFSGDVAARLVKQMGQSWSDLSTACKIKKKSKTRK